jgi:hypothetical protein
MSPAPPVGGRCARATTGDADHYAAPVPVLRRISSAPVSEAAPPPSRASDALTRLTQPLALIAIAVVAVLVGAMLIEHALLIWTHTFDEDIYKGVGVYTQDHFPSALWETHFSTRGIQRLEGWVFAAGYELADAPTAFRIIRVINIVFFCSTVIPVWLWARSLGTRAVPAAAAAALAILVPWATVTSMFFTENVAYPAVTWALYSTWAAASRPGLRRLLLALVAVFVATLARSVMLVLPVLLVVSIIAVALRCHGARAWAARRTWTPRQITVWALPALAVLAGVAVYVLDRSRFSEQLTGSYTADVDLRLSDLSRLSRISIARVISGVGILPGIVAVAWVGRTLSRSIDPERFALAVLAVLVAAFVSYSAMRGGPDERYLMYLAPVLALCAAQAADRREVGPVAVMVTAGLVVWLFAIVPWSSDQHDYGFLVSSAQAFHARILLLGLGSHASVGGLSYAAILAIGILVVSAVTAWAFWWGGRAGAWVGVALAAGVLIVQIVQLSYVERHFQREAAWGPDLNGRVWVDRALPAGADAGLFMTNQNSNVVPVGESFREVAFWNLKLDRALMMPVIPQMYATTATGQGVDIDPATGRIVPRSASQVIPRYLVEPRLQPIAPLVGRTIAEAGYEPFALVDAGPAPRVQWHLTGVDEMSWSLPGHRPTIRVYRAARPTAGHCLALRLTPPGELQGARKVVVRSGRWHRTLTMKAGYVRTLGHVPLTPHGPSAVSDVTLDVASITRLADGRRTGVNVSSIARVACAPA